MRENSVIDYDSALGGIITADDEKTCKLIQGTNSLQYLLNKPETFQNEFISHLRSAKTCLNEICMTAQVFSKAINSLKEKLSETVTQIELYTDKAAFNKNLALKGIDSAIKLADKPVEKVVEKLWKSTIFRGCKSRYLGCKLRYLRCKLRYLGCKLRYLEESL